MTVMINRVVVFILCVFMMTCVTDYSVITNKKIVEGKDTQDTTQVVVDYYVQPEKPEDLDVLVILDTSCSMSDNFENVSIGLDILRDDIEVLTYDYQMGLINSSLREPYFVGPIGPATTSMEIYIAPYTLGEDRNEEPFASLYLFTSTPEGQEFLRNGVDKLYIFVSDEPEQSRIPVSTFKEWMNEYHTDVNHDVVVIGINEQSDCDTYYHLEEDAENRFKTLATYYNKTIIDICGDFQLALAENSFIINPITHMQLSEPAIEDSIVVYNNGNIEQMWYYLPETNTVYFEFPIDGGEIVKIGYLTSTI